MSFPGKTAATYTAQSALHAPATTPSIYSTGDLENCQNGQGSQGQYNTHSSQQQSYNQYNQGDRYNQGRLQPSHPHTPTFSPPSTAPSSTANRSDNFGVNSSSATPPANTAMSQQYQPAGYAPYQSNTVNGVTYNNPNSAPPMPSNQVQTYSVPTGNVSQNGQNYVPANAQNGQVQFQYSQCNGVKKALLIGINYIGTSNQLRGCINDAHNMYNFLLANGYPAENIVMLTDDSTNYVQIPTRENMLRAMQWLVSDARQGDSLFFHYSGHGGQEDDLDSDEADGQDDCIYPVDFQRTGSIIDDIMHEIMVKPLPPGCRLTALFDSCHSGTALDLPFTYRAQDGGLKEYNVWKESGGDAMNLMLGYANRNPVQMFQAASSVYKRFAANTSSRQDKIKQQKYSAADVIMFSGCKDSQTSADAQEAGQFTGALSWALIAVLRQNPVQSYLTLLQNLRSVLSTKYTQKPQLSSSHQIDPNLRFIF